MSNNAQFLDLNQEINRKQRPKRQKNVLLVTKKETRKVNKIKDVKFYPNGSKDCDATGSYSNGGRQSPLFR